MFWFDLKKLLSRSFVIITCYDSLRVYLLRMCIGIHFKILEIWKSNNTLQKRRIVWSSLKKLCNLYIESPLVSLHNASLSIYRAFKYHQRDTFFDDALKNFESLIKTWFSSATKWKRRFLLLRFSELKGKDTNCCLFRRWRASSVMLIQCGCT